MYTVISYNVSVVSPNEVARWLNHQYERYGLELVTVVGTFFIFKERKRKLERERPTQGVRAG